jgi:hypothetical protein
MGALQAREMANAPELTMEQAIEWHLRTNHYPPIPSSMVLPCMEAIDAYWGDDLDKEIAMPTGVYYKGRNTAPAREIIIQHHLDAWCEEEFEYEDYE